jgi:hypothetical protein
MKKLLAAMMVILMLGLAGAAGYAAEEGSSPPPASPAAQVKEDDRLPIYPQDEWQFFVSPYIWIPGINANINSLGASTSTNVAWWDVATLFFSHAIGVMGRAEAWKGRWGLYVDGYYAYLGFKDSQVGAGRDKNFGPVNLGSVGINLPGQVSGTITMTPSGSASYISRVVSLDMGGRFLVGTWPMKAGQQFPVLSLELLGGLRFNSLNQFLKINFSNIRVGTVNVDFRRFSLSADHQSIRNGAYTLSHTLQVFEPFIGPRISVWLNRKFVLSFKGTVGGFGLVAYNNLTCDLETLLGYRVNKTLYAYGGYRAAGTWANFGEGQTKVSFAGWFHGPVLGVTYKF